MRSTQPLPSVAESGELVDPDYTNSDSRHIWGPMVLTVLPALTVVISGVVGMAVRTTLVKVTAFWNWKPVRLEAVWSRNCRSHWGR